MNTQTRSRNARDFRPSLNSLEGRALLTGTASHVAHVAKAAAHPAPPEIKIVNKVDAHGYRFVNFDGPGAGNVMGVGTTTYNISNKGVVLASTLSNDQVDAPGVLTYTNFAVSTRNGKFGKVDVLTKLSNPGQGVTAINSSGVVVGSNMPDELSPPTAFSFYKNKLHTLSDKFKGSSQATGINDANVIVGVYGTNAGQLGFARLTNGKVINIELPSSVHSVFSDHGVYPTAINKNGLIVGHYTHFDSIGNYITSGFIAKLNSAKNGLITVTPVADPNISALPGEQGQTLAGSNFTGINDKGIAVGYFTDSNYNNHGFIYNTNTGKYTFLDDPSAVPSQGQIYSEITGINNSNEIIGFYTDANFVLHGFVAKKM